MLRGLRSGRLLAGLVLMLVVANGLGAAGGQSSYTFTTYAGVIGYYGALDGTGTNAAFNFPNDLALDRNGNLFVADTGNSTIRKIAPGGVVTTVAGSPGVAGYADGQGTAARFNGPRGLTVDAGGNLYVADSGNHVIRKVAPDGTVTTLAGKAGTTGSLDGTGTAATFNQPLAVKADANGNVLVSDFQNFTIRKITPAGVVTTVAGKAGSAANWLDGTGSAARFAGPAGLAFDSAGNLYIADSHSYVIRKMTPDGVVTTVAGTGGVPGSSDVSPTKFNQLYGVAVDSAGNVYVADTVNETIRMVATNGTVTTLAGTTGVKGTTGGAGGSTLFYDPIGIVVAPDGTLYIADANNHAIRQGSPSSAPVISTPPAALTLAAGTKGILTVTAAGANLAYQWKRNGADLPGATSPYYVIGSAGAGDAGDYTVAVSNSFGTALSSAATVTVVATTDVGRLLNLSVRTNAGTGAETLIVGVVVGGTGTAGTKATLIRAVGPRLGDYGVTGVLADPRMEFIDQGGTVLATNDDWGGDAQVAAVGASVGAFPLGSSTSKDAALYNPAVASGPYSVKILGAGGSTGIALAEIYDATPSGSFAAATPRLINVSARTGAGTGSATLIAGFVVGGSTARTVLIRGVGPRLADYGVPGALADPQLQLYRAVGSDSVLVAANDDWGAATNAAVVATTAAQVGAFALNAGSKDAVLLLTLPPGVYSAQVSGVNGVAGIALVEVYEVP
ncbi:MAG TPA: hypothetical protein PLU52_05170 [Opitutaceae bacterium]|nr:hypothetical protein [Opitutaceae bacterium]